MVFKTGYKMTEEHKRKIGLANAIALKGKHCSPKTEFKKGMKPFEYTGYNDKEKSYLWKGGISRCSAKKTLIENGRNLKVCQICEWIKKNNFLIIDSNKNIKDSNKIVIHHINGNQKDNRIQNLAVLCYFCHNAIHDNRNRIKNRFYNRTNLGFTNHQHSEEGRKNISNSLKGMKINLGKKYNKNKLNSIPC